MPAASLQLGAVYQPDWDHRPIRVIAFDEDLVMYDVWWPHKEAWGFARRIPPVVAYYRVSTAFLLKRARYLRTEPYTEQEVDTHQPDLPFAFARSDAVSWYDDLSGGVAEISQRLGKERDELLRASQVCVCPFGPKHSIKKGVLIEAPNGQAFSVAEILFAAWKIQRPYLRQEHLTKGVGLYRLGLERRVPSYSLWGAKSRLEELASK